MKFHCVICLIFFVLNTAQACDTLQDLKTIGQADLTVWGLSVYSARTLSCDGKKISSQQALPNPFVLELTYARNITQKALLENTRAQWRHLGLYNQRAESWLAQLAQIWPSVEKEDRLTLFVTPHGTSQFYLADQPLGDLMNEEFSKHFLAIWLSQDASYPRARKKLLGQKS